MIYYIIYNIIYIYIILIYMVIYIYNIYQHIYIRNTQYIFIYICILYILQYLIRIDFIILHIKNDLIVGTWVPHGTSILSRAHL